jgi:hypothetical protein
MSKHVAISQEEQLQVKAMFSAADVNGDGTIDLDELKILLGDLGFPEDQIQSKAASIMNLYAPPASSKGPKSATGGALLDRNAFVKVYAHFKEKESARLAAFSKDRQAIAMTKVGAVLLAFSCECMQRV